MSDLLTISLVQVNPIWQDVDANIKLLNESIETIEENTDLIILPEMFLTGFSMDVHKIAQKMDGKGVQWLSTMAQKKKAIIMGSLTIQENNNFYNRMLIADSDGTINWYDKRHLFRMGEEHLHFSPGNQLFISKIKDWKVMPLVCYDLRFPVWSRNINLKYDLLIYVANWPESRRDAFLTLLKARAIENQCYVAAVNRVGTDGNGIKYSGDSVIIDSKGTFLTELSDLENVFTTKISLKGLNEFRKKFPTYLDADNFEIK